jgi:MraZ protein
MLLGEYEYKVDNKGRLPIPPKFRQEFKEGVVLTQGMEECIVAYKKSDFEKLAANYTAEKFANSKMRRLNRLTFGHAFDLEMDNQGRIALPVSLKQHAKIVADAIIIGANNCIEIWSPDKWNNEEADGAGQMWQIVESLEGQ